jgi:lipooligosaccharide transport system ATP-binding protein
MWVGTLGLQDAVARNPFERCPIRGIECDLVREMSQTTSEPDDAAVELDGPMIVARGLRKRYGGLEAVRGIDVTVERGEAFGFLGPNGAGKSSTMRMVGAVSPPSAGELRILGMDPAVDGSRIRGRLGVCPQLDTLDMEISVLENLTVYGRYFGLSRAECARRAGELLDFVQLTDKADGKVEELSGGMKRRLSIARSLINSPDVLLLDEPTTGLDPQARHLVWERLFRLKQRGVTLVLTTHYMDEAEQLCDRLVVMDKGEIVAEGSPTDLIRTYSTREVTELRFGVGEHDDVVAEVKDLADRVEVLPDRVLLYTDDGEAAAVAVHERGLEPMSVLVRRSTLEDVFLRLTGRTLVD